MAFKLRSQNIGSMPLHKSGQGSFKTNPFSNIKTPLFAIDPITEKEKKKKKEEAEEDYEEIDRTVTTREGVQDGVSGTFTDTNINEQMITEDYDIEVTPGGRRTKLPDDEYVASLINSGIGREEAAQRKLVDPKFLELFPLTIDNRQRVETTFEKNPPMENPYSGYDTGYAYNTDFGTGGKLGYIGRTDDPAEANKIIQRGENVSANTNARVEGLNASQQQGGTSGMIDQERNNFQSEQGYVVGIKNEEDYDAYDNFGLGRTKGFSVPGFRDGYSSNPRGAIQQDFKAAKVALQEKYRGSKDRTAFNKEKQALIDLRTAKKEAARSGKFYSPEMKQRFTDSHDTIYERKQDDGLFTQPTGGGRSGLIASPSETTINSGFLNTVLSDLELAKADKQKKRLEAARLRRR